jgi:photosystem II stability/assembly factor-like uncharacterized protein
MAIAAWLNAGTTPWTDSAAPRDQMRGRLNAALSSASRTASPMARSHAVAAMKAMPALSPVAGQWIFMGPDSITNGQGLSASGECGAPARIRVTGRVTAIGFGAQGMYVGSAAGGVWKSTDGGTSWIPLTDSQPSLAVGALAVLPGPPDTIYAGTGEGNNGCDNEYGQGILKSSDGGISWTQLGAATFDGLTFTRIAVEKSNPAVLYAATSFGFDNGAAGECFSVSTATAGLYKSSDAGLTWTALSGSGGLPAGAAGATVDGSGSVYDTIIDPARSFTGPFTGTVVAEAGAGCAGMATLTAVDPNNSRNSKPFKLTAEPIPAGGFDLDATLTLTQDPVAGLNPPGICDDFSGTYTCSGTVPNLDGAPVSDLTCVGGNFNKGAGTTLTLTGSFAAGETDAGSFTGTWSLDAGAGPDTVDKAPVALASAPAVFAAVGGASGGLFRSTDGGTTWAQAGAIAAGRRFAMDFAPDGDRFYVASTTLTSPSGFGALYISTDHGATFRIGLGQPNIGGAGCLTEDQGDHDLALAVDPADPNHLYLGMIGVYVSSDGGASFSYTGAGTHGGQHAIEVNGSRVYVGNNGGLFQSDDGGASWAARNSGLGIAQFQSIALDPSGTTVLGGTQDNGTNTTLGSLTWSHSDDGDGGFVLIDSANPAIFFDEQSGLSINRSNSSGALGTYTAISPGAAGTDPIQLHAPFTADPSNPERVLLGTIRLWETCHASGGKMVCDGASSPSPPIWTVLSADLTGGCTSAMCDISDIAVAPTNPNVAYVVTSSDGTTGPMVWVTLDGTNPAPTLSITPGGVAGRPLTSVVVSPLNYQEVVITASGFTGGGGHVFVSSDAGATWSDISAGLPDIPALSAAFDPAAPFANLFVGTDIGVSHTADLGHSWTNANLESLPVVPVYLRQGQGTVFAATHGRGVWKLESPSPTSSPTPGTTPVPSATPTPTATPGASPTPTPVPGHPFINRIPSVIVVGGGFDINGLNFTAGSVVNFFVATATGPVNSGPLIPTTWTPTDLAVDVPPGTGMGEGFVSLEVVNTDHAYVKSNLAFGLLQGSAAAGIPTISAINGVPLATTSSNPGFAVDNVETVVKQGAVVSLGGSGFDVSNGVAVDLFCACPGGKVGPFYFKPGTPGLSSGSIAFTLPVSGGDSPSTGPGSFVVINKGPTGAYALESNGVSVPIGAQIRVASVSQSGTGITVNGSGFSPFTVINFFNLQGAGAVNLGGISDGAPAIPIRLASSTQFTFTVPSAALPGPAYVQAINPPFVPFTTSGSDPGGGFTLH